MTSCTATAVAVRTDSTTGEEHSTTVVCTRQAGHGELHECKRAGYLTVRWAEPAGPDPNEVVIKRETLRTLYENLTGHAARDRENLTAFAAAMDEARTVLGHRLANPKPPTVRDQRTGPRPPINPTLQRAAIERAKRKHGYVPEDEQPGAVTTGQLEERGESP